MYSIHSVDTVRCSEDSTALLTFPAQKPASKLAGALMAGNERKNEKVDSSRANSSHEAVSSRAKSNLPPSRLPNQLVTANKKEREKSKRVRK
jgi:hypothetical protein